MTFIIIAAGFYSCALILISSPGIPYFSQVAELDPVIINADSIIRTVHQIDNLEFPYVENPDNIISHTGFSFLFNDAHKQSD